MIVTKSNIFKAQKPGILCLYLILFIFVTALTAVSHTYTDFATKSFRVTGKAFLLASCADLSKNRVKVFTRVKCKARTKHFPLTAKANDPRLRQAEVLKRVYPLGVGVNTF